MGNRRQQATRPREADTEAFRQRMGERVDQISAELLSWLQDNTQPHEAAAVSVALLRLAVNMHIIGMGEAAAFEHLRELFSSPPSQNFYDHTGRIQ